MKINYWNTGREIQLTVSTIPATKCANGSTVVIGCLAISTQSKEIWHVVLFYCSAALRMDEHLLVFFVLESCEMKTYVYRRAAVWFKFNPFILFFGGEGGTLYFYVAAYRISLDVLCKSEHFFLRNAFQLRHTNPYVTLHFLLLFSCMLYKIHTNDGRMKINEHRPSKYEQENECLPIQNYIFHEYILHVTH